MNKIYGLYLKLKIDKINNRITYLATLYEGRMSRLEKTGGTGEYESAVETLIEHDNLVLKQNKLVQLLGVQNDN
ncbi:MAG: hypothetical protein KKF48_04880 [Nanoarchaeota archaeon]|nr:hypothetical protein [Nanoarchaeota archaeon]MBU1028351.1 hypothetical protein [Nanoarchaeota archaeon]